MVEVLESGSRVTNNVRLILRPASPDSPFFFFWEFSFSLFLPGFGSSLLADPSTFGVVEKAGLGERRPPGDRGPPRCFEAPRIIAISQSDEL